MAETSKAHQRRIDAGWFDKYIKGYIIDVGVGRIDTHDGADPVTPDCVMHDKDICDATTMEAYPDNTFDCVHASHILEHLDQPARALHNWLRICKPNGHLVISVPERDRYERQLHLPSRWNEDHKTMWLYNTPSLHPWTHNLHRFVAGALSGIHIVEYQLIDTCTNNDKLNEHANGEFSIEIVVKKLPPI